PAGVAAAPKWAPPGTRPCHVFSALPALQYRQSLTRRAARLYRGDRKGRGPQGEARALAAAAWRCRGDVCRGRGTQRGERTSATYSAGGGHCALRRLVPRLLPRLTALSRPLP